MPGLFFASCWSAAFPASALSLVARQQASVMLAYQQICVVTMKYLLLIAFFFAILWMLRRAQSSRSGRRPPPAARAPERMVKCAYCGVNQPVSESILTHGRYYCCDAHRLEADSLDD
jgi:uncharacterized protein